MISLLAGAGRHGRLFLVAGLLGGLGLPTLAQELRPWLPEMVALLMFLAALRIGWSQTRAAVHDLRRLGGLILALQLALPLVVALALAVTGLAATLPGMALILVTAGSSISGSPNLTVMTGGDPAPALRLLILGTALLPLTVIPVFLLAGGLGSPLTVFFAAARLLAVIGAATAAAFLLRAWLMPDPAPRTIAAVDGASAIAMGVIVIGLMSAVGPALRTAPADFALWLGFAMAVNLGLQLLCWLTLRSRVERDMAIPVSIIAGNRNIALFLVALPTEVTTPLLLFIGCYQIPMYLTPILMGRVYRPAD